MDDRDKRKLRAAKRRRVEVIAYTVEIVAAVCMVGVLVAFLIWHNSFTNIKMSDYVTLSLAGFDHYGTATPLINGESEYSEFWSTVSATLDKTEDLSNGDTVTITYEFDEEVARASKLRVDATESTVTIEDLPESKVIDDAFMFSGLIMTQNGISPKVTFEVGNNSEDPFVSGITYYIDDERTFFADGDTLRIKAELPEGALDSHEYVTDKLADEYVYEYPVVSEDKYVMSAAQISAEALKTMEDYGTDMIYAADANEYGLRIFQQEAHIQPVFKGNKTTFKWVNPYVISAYFHNVTEAGLQQVENHANDVQIVYGVTITQDDGKSCMAEIVVQFTNIIEHADGSLELTPDMGRIVSATYRDKNVKKLVSIDSNENYDTTKLTE
ncbi:MAG: hypothetical protein J5509_00905 [Lachnospiraceae bacterium]|nr:hypothetical protein [Lachnospiraceae bacterium]